MSNIQVKSFESPKKFFDDLNFPRGFQRAGDFTRNQAQILESMGVALKALHEGTREPATDEEERFVSMCKQEIQPQSEVERTWSTYMKALARKQIYFTASSAAVSESGSDSIDTDD